MIDYIDFKNDVIGVSYAGEVRKNNYVPKIDFPYDFNYIRRVIFAEHFDEKIQSASLDGKVFFTELSKERKIENFLNSSQFNSLKWKDLRLFVHSDFNLLRMQILNNNNYLSFSLINTFYIINNRLICCDPSEPAFGFGSMATAGNGAFVK